MVASEGHDSVYGVTRGAIKRRGGRDSEVKKWLQPQHTHTRMHALTRAQTQNKEGRKRWRRRARRVKDDALCLRI